MGEVFGFDPSGQSVLSFPGLSDFQDSILKARTLFPSCTDGHSEAWEPWTSPSIPGMQCVTAAGTKS